MAVKIKRDADNKWFVYIDWSVWLADQSSQTGGTVTITSVSWLYPAAIVEEAETPSDDINGKTYFVGSGGSNGFRYDLVATITYTVSVLSATDLTQDKTVTVELVDQ